MGGPSFVPGRDRHIIESLAPEDMRRRQTAEASERRAELDREDLEELERKRTGAQATPRKPTLLDRILRWR